MNCSFVLVVELQRILLCSLAFYNIGKIIGMIPPFLRGNIWNPERELLAASNLYRAFAMIKFFHSTWPHVILRKPDVWMFSLSLTWGNWCSQSCGVSWPRPHRVWRAQLDFPPRTSLTWSLAEPVPWQWLRMWAPCVPCTHPQPEAKTLPPYVALCARTLPEPHLAPGNGSIAWWVCLWGDSGGVYNLGDKRLFWRCRDIEEARGGKLENPTLGMSGQTPIVTKCSWKHASVANHDGSLFLKFLI